MDVIRCRTCSTPLLPTASFCGTCGDTISSEDNPLDSPTVHGSTVSEDQYATVATDAVLPMSQISGSLASADRLKISREEAEERYETIPTEAPEDMAATGPKEGEIASKDTTHLANFTNEQDTIAAHPTVPLKEERDETEVLPFIPLPGQFTASPTPQRAEHKQPEMQRAEHRQIQDQRAEHLQVNNPRAQHFQPVMLVRAQQPGHRKSGMQNILIGLSAAIVAAVIIMAALPIFHPSTSTGPRLALVNATSAFPGGSVQLHGTNFTSGAPVSITVDGTASSSAETLPGAEAHVDLGIALLATMQHLQYSASPETIVQNDGTFDATISIPSDWLVNTTHDIQAIEQGSGQKALTKVTVVDRPPSTSLPISLPTPGATSVQKPHATATADPTQSPLPTSVASITPIATTLAPTCIKVDNTNLTFNAAVGGTAPGTQAVTISDGAGCSAGGWTLTADSPWLTADQSSGTIAVNGSAKVNIGVSPANLKVGSYTGHIHVGTNTITVTLNIQLLPTCITATTGTLTFSATAGGTAPAQTATIANGANCSAGTWSAASDTNWLLVKGGGQIGTGASAKATVTISTTGLAAGNRTGHLTFSASGSNPATVTVTLTVQQPLCLTSNQNMLTFGGDVGANSMNPGPQRIIVTNCGRAGTITATNGGVNWLTVTGGGQANAGAQTVFAVQATCINPNGSLLLPAVATAYTTTITFTITAADGTTTTHPVAVTFNVTKSAPGIG